MAGHSKWANIKHRKARQDNIKGKIFGRIIKEITVAARLGGGIADDNPRLRLALNKAMAANLPKDNIKRAIDRGAGNADAQAVEEVTYEGYAKGGVAVLVDTVTDNRNRTVAEVRHAFSKYGGNLGTDGSVAFLFEKAGIIEIKSELSEEVLVDIAIELGAEDIFGESPNWELKCGWDNLNNVIEACERQEIDVINYDIIQVPENWVEVSDEARESVEKLLMTLDDLIDTQQVFTNMKDSE